MLRLRYNTSQKLRHIVYERYCIQRRVHFLGFLVSVGKLNAETYFGMHFNTL